LNQCPELTSGVLGLLKGHPFDMQGPFRPCQAPSNHLAEAPWALGLDSQMDRAQCSPQKAARAVARPAIK